MKHVHHDLIAEWAKDTSRGVQRYNEWSSQWEDCPWPNWVLGTRYRFKPAEPKFIVVNGVQVPEPVRGGLVDGQVVWVSSVLDGKPFDFGFDAGVVTDQRWLSLGLIHLTREAAQAHIDAMLLPSRSDK